MDDIKNKDKEMAGYLIGYLNNGYDIQIKSILVSLVFGFLFSLLLKINYRYI